MRFSKYFLLAATAVLPLVSQASPVAVTTNPNLSVAGLSFSDFGCSITRGGVMAHPNNCNQIKVGTITSPGNGIQFTSGFVAGPLSFDDAVLTYDVKADAGVGIHSVGLYFNGTFDGLAISQVTESVYSADKLVGFAKVTCDMAGCNRQDNILLDGIYTDLHIEKDIIVAAAVWDATLSIVDQTFGTCATPEPASFALIGAGLIGMAGLLRRRMKAVTAKAESNS
jgi:hypothetical protein